MNNRYANFCLGWMDGYDGDKPRHKLDPGYMAAFKSGRKAADLDQKDIMKMFDPKNSRWVGHVTTGKFPPE